jgi:ribosome-associated toxin RatA of RatAB toxin-antitoxin module
MPQVESTIFMRAPLPLVWELAQDVEKYPGFMPDLDGVKVLEREPVNAETTRVVSEWHARIKQMNRKIDWTEEDIWNTKDHTCHFWQMRGDFDEYKGEYSFVDEDNGTRATLKMEYRFDIPLIGAMMQKVIQKLMQDNCTSMLRALRDEAERRAGA